MCVSHHFCQTVKPHNRAPVRRVQEVLAATPRRKRRHARNDYTADQSEKEREY